MSKKVKIFIGLPTMGELNTYTVVSIMTYFTNSVHRGDMDMMVYPTVGIRPHDRARNTIVEEFLKTDATHLFFIDADTVPPPDALDKLLKADKDIISGLTPIIEHDPNRANDSSGFYKKWNCVGEDDQLLKPNMGIVPIKGAGGSCILIKREVFEGMEYPWYKFATEDDNGKKVEISEDIYFVIMAISKGFKPFADTSVIAKHSKNILWILMIFVLPLSQLFGTIST